MQSNNCIMPPKRSQVTMLEHSKAKVLLLKRYLEKYLNIIANDGFTQRIDIFDLFCGEGIYENNGIGSPIGILDALKDLHTINKAKVRNIPKVNLYFNDFDKSKVEKLKKTIENKKLHENAYGEIHYRDKDYKELVGGLASHTQKLKNEKAFIFVDPYGYKEIRASEIKSFLLSKKSEVLLFLPTQFMYRFDEKGTPQSLIDILSELVELKNWKPNKSVYHFIEQFKNALKNYLGSDFFVDTFTIEKDSATVFCLYFFSSHIRGFEKMLETKWQLDEDEGKGWSYEKTSDLFAIFKTNPLEEKLISLIKSSKAYNGYIYEFTLRNGFLPKHAVEVLSSLQAKGNLEVLSNAQEKVRKGSFYINYDSYKENFEKVFFKIK